MARIPTCCATRVSMMSSVMKRQLAAATAALVTAKVKMRGFGFSTPTSEEKRISSDSKRLKSRSTGKMVRSWARDKFAVFEIIPRRKPFDFSADKVAFAPGSQVVVELPLTRVSPRSKKMALMEADILLAKLRLWKRDEGRRISGRKPTRCIQDRHD